MPVLVPESDLRNLQMGGDVQASGEFILGPLDERKPSLDVCAGNPKRKIDENKIEPLQAPIILPELLFPSVFIYSLSLLQ